MYADHPDGLIGNEDCGQMSAWYVLSAIGFYQVTPGSDIWVFGTPLFDEVTMRFENGKEFTIQSTHHSPENIYIQAVQLNGIPYTKSWISQADLMKGGKLTFFMGNITSQTWGVLAHDCPKSAITEPLIVPVPFVSQGANSFRDTTHVTLGSIDPDSKIYYSVSEKDPDTTATLYTGSFTLNKSTWLRFIAWNGKAYSPEVQNLFYHIPNGRTIELGTQFANQYSAGGNEALIDGLKGTNDFRLGYWQGYTATNLEATIDLGQKQTVKKVTMRFLQDINSWIFMPEWVEYSISEDGRNFRTFARINTQTQPNNWTITIEEFSPKMKALSGRYIKVIAKNRGICPPDHKAAGQPAWIFSDEIIIE